jgi:hypothetical protein
LIPILVAVAREVTRLWKKNGIIGRMDFRANLAAALVR